jgi:hypothetical protein
MKQIEDPIEVLCAIALLEKEATLGSRSGTKRRHDALGQFDKTGEAGWFRNASSAKKDDVASIALLQKLDWDTGTIREKTHTAFSLEDASCNLLRPRGPDDQTHADAKPRQHVDQCVGTEQVDSTAQEIAHSGLRDPKHFRGLSLFEPL